MRSSRIKAKLRRNEPALITTLHYTDATLYEMTSLMGFDGIWMDLEHHHYSVETAANLMRAARVGTSDIVARPSKGEFMRMDRLLEAGAQGIMYPRCESANLAQRTTSAASAALSQRGYMMPCAPASSRRAVRMNSPLAGRVMISAEPTRAARIRCAAVSTL